MIRLHRVDGENNRGAEVLVPVSSVFYAEERIWHSFRPGFGTVLHLNNGQRLEIYEAIEDVRKCFEVWGEKDKVMS